MDPVVYPFHLGVVAPLGFEVPELVRRIRPRLRTLLDRRIGRREPVSLMAVGGEPVSKAVREIADAKGWGYSFAVKPGHRSPRQGHLAACGQIATTCDGVILFHADGEPIPEDLAALLAVVRRMGVLTRTVGV